MNKKIIGSVVLGVLLVSGIAYMATSDSVGGLQSAIIKARGVGEGKIAETITLNSVTSYSGDYFRIIYSKNFDTCVHMYDANNRIMHTKNLFCERSASILVPLSDIPSMRAGNKVRLKHGNKDIWSEFVEVQKNIGPALQVTFDTANSLAKAPKNVLAGTISSYIAAYSLKSQNEPVKIQDIDLSFFDENMNVHDFTNSVNTVNIYGSDNALLASKTVSGSNTVSFVGLNYTVGTAGTTLYVSVTTNRIGLNNSGKHTKDIKMGISVTKAEGVNSGEYVSGLPIKTTMSSALFAVVPVRISNISFVNSYAGTSIATNLSGASDIVGILAITADNSTNTRTSDGAPLKLELDDIRIQFETSNISAITSARLIKINGSDADGVLDTGTCTTLCIFDTNRLTGDDELINSGTTAYYKIVVDSQQVPDSLIVIKPTLAQLDNGATGTTASVEYSSDDAATLISNLRLGFPTLSGAKISSYN